MNNKRTFCVALIIVTNLLCVGAVSIGASKKIVVNTPMAPPAWALMERQLMEEKAQHIEDFYRHFFDANGYLLHTLRWGILDGPDDLFDIFGDWTLLYSLGGRRSVLDLYRKGYTGGARQYSEYKTVMTDIAREGAYYREFVSMSDFHHTGEGLRGFHLEGLTEPADYTYQARARRYAGFYIGEDSDAPNYDPVNKVIRSLWTGSRGPLMRRAKPIDWAGDPVYGKFHVLHGPAGAREMQEITEDVFENEMLAHCYEYLHSVGDHPLNMISVHLALNAYGLSQEQKYLDWVNDYMGAWAERIDKNGGNCPTNIGLDGSIGGETDGKWYGGTYGWDHSPWSPEHKEVAHRNMFAKGLWPGCSSALLMTGDQKYVDILRRQIDNIYAQKEVIDGVTVYPQNYGEKNAKTGPPKFEWRGEDLYWTEEKLTEPQWYHFTSNAYIPQCTEIYLYSMDHRDYERVKDVDWIRFIEGDNPDYPIRALETGFAEVRDDSRRMRNDRTTPDTRLPDWPMQFNRFGATLTLNRLMCGAYLHGMIYNQHARFRYFDPEKRRSGIPESVAALVTAMDKEKTTLVLVNTSQTRAHDVVVQTGAYGEHQCSRVVVDGKSYPVNHRFFRVRLEPGAGEELVVYADRYANRPTLALPWHGDTVPAPEIR
jgi:hypothetical protein